MEIIVLNKLFKEVHKAIQDNSKPHAMFGCNSILVTLKPYNNGYSRRMEKQTRHLQYIIKNEWHRQGRKNDLLSALKCMIRESQAQMKINRSA